MFYKRCYVWFNELQGWHVQIGYEILDTYKTIGGAKAWKLKNGDFHNENGPAIEFPGGTKVWKINNKLLATVPESKRFPLGVSSKNHT